MSNQVLYRKHRPKSFKDVVGQEHVVQTLKNALSTDNVAHAYLFTGPRGTGKTTLARLFTKSLNCTSRKEDGESCLKCDTCTEMDNGNHVDLIEIDAASNRGIDEIRELKEGVRFAPTKGAYKVYLVDEAHMLTKDASNALLKTLEEPPAHAVFVLATTEPHKILPTIISRCQKFDLFKLNHEQIKNRLAGILKKENKKVDDEVVRLVFAASGGSLRDAESLLGKVLHMEDLSAESVRDALGVPDMQRIAEFVDLIYQAKKGDAVQFINNLAQEGKDLEQFAASTLGYVRTLLLLRLSPSSHDIATSYLTKEETNKAKEQSGLLTDKDLYSIIRELLEVQEEIKYAPLQQLPLELAVVNLTKDKNTEA